MGVVAPERRFNSLATDLPIMNGGSCMYCQPTIQREPCLCLAMTPITDLFKESKGQSEDYPEIHPRFSIPYPPSEPDLIVKSVFLS